VSGLGEVCDARDHERGRDVSLRILHTDFGGDDDRRQRFARESGAAALLDHPHILTVHDVGADAQAVYIVSDPITGRTLREVLDGGPIPPGAGAPFVPQIRDAVAAAHARGVAHGHLTPDAILFTPDGVKVIGFGLAAVAASGKASAPADVKALDALSALLGAPPVPERPPVARPAGGRWPPFAAVLGVIAFAGLIGMWLTTGNHQPAPTAPIAVAPEAEPPVAVIDMPPPVLPGGPSRLVWLDDTGAEAGVLGEVADYGDVALSPDGTRVAVSIREPGVCCQSDIWVIDVSSGTRTRLTSTPGSKSGVAWSPDGTRVAFSAAPGGSSDIYETASGGAGVVRPLVTTSLEEVSWDWASTGFLLYAGDRVGQPRGPHLDLWARRLPGGRPFTYLRSVHRATLPSMSPDGRWVAFMLRPIGADQADVYAGRFPKYDGRVRLSAGAAGPRWRGNTIFYIDSAQRLVSVPVSSSGSRLELGPASRVGDQPVKDGSGYSYDVSPDGRRVLVNTVRVAPFALSRRAP
jgi:serine/threonine protein kinase